MLPPTDKESHLILTVCNHGHHYAFIIIQHHPNYVLPKSRSEHGLAHIPPTAPPDLCNLGVLSPGGLPLGALSHLLFAFLLEILLLRLSIESLELGITLGLPHSLTLGRPLVGLLVLLSLLDRLDGSLADRLDLAQHLWTEVGALGKSIGNAHKLLEDGHKAVVVIIGGERISQNNAFARGGLLDTLNKSVKSDTKATYLRSRLVLWLVRHNEVLKVIAGSLGSLDEIRGKKQVGDFSALSHHCQPAGQFGVVFGVGQ